VDCSSLGRFRMAEKASEQVGWPLYPIDDCGHRPHIERPDVFVEALKVATAATGWDPRSSRAQACVAHAFRERASLCP
jgi:hypothetical protein